MLRLGYDSSEPPANPPAWAFNMFYIGGDTPHVWSLREVMEQPTRYKGPIFVHTGQDTEEAGKMDSGLILSALTSYGVPKGVTVWIDTETNLYHAYLETINRIVTAEGWTVGNYGSLRFVILNPPTSGGRWSADWRDIQQLDPGHDIRMTQFADAAILGTDYDGDVTDSSAALWDTRPDIEPVWAEQSLHNLAEAAALVGRTAALLRKNT